MGSYDIYKVPSANYDEQKCDANVQKEDVYWEEFLTWINTSCVLLKSFCYVTEALVFPCFVTHVSNGTGCTKRTFWIWQHPLHHCESLLLMVTPLHMSQKNSSLCTIHSSKLSEISGLSLLCATLGYQSSFIFGLSWVWLFLVLLSFSREILGKRLHYYHDGVLTLLVLWGVMLYAWLISGVPLFEENNCLLIKGSRVSEK